MAATAVISVCVALVSVFSLSLLIVTRVINKKTHRRMSQTQIEYVENPTYGVENQVRIHHNDTELLLEQELKD